MAVVFVWHRGHCGNVYLHLWLRIYDFAVMAICKLVTIFSVFFCGVTLLSKSNVEDCLTGAICGWRVETDGVGHSRKCLVEGLGACHHVL